MHADRALQGSSLAAHARIAVCWTVAFSARGGPKSCVPCAPWAAGVVSRPGRADRRTGQVGLPCKVEEQHRRAEAGGRWDGTGRLGQGGGWLAVNISHGASLPGGAPAWPQRQSGSGACHRNRSGRAPAWHQKPTGRLGSIPRQHPGSSLACCQTHPGSEDLPRHRLGCGPTWQQEGPGSGDCRRHQPRSGPTLHRKRTESGSSQSTTLGSCPPRCQQHPGNDHSLGHGPGGAVLPPGSRGTPGGVMPQGTTPAVLLPRIGSAPGAVTTSRRTPRQCSAGRRRRTGAVSSSSGVPCLAPRAARGSSQLLGRKPGRAPAWRRKDPEGGNLPGAPPWERYDSAAARARGCGSPKRYPRSAAAWHRTTRT